MNFEKIYQESNIILTEGALVERLKSEFNAEMDPYLNHAGLIYTNPGALECLYRQYLDIGKEFDLPVMIMTPTRKINTESVESSQFKGKPLLKDSCHFLSRIKESYQDYSGKIIIGGLLGCKGDAYSGEKVLGIEEAYKFHRQQTLQFEKGKIDYLFAGIMPEINEAIGMAKAMAESQIPYIISFMIQKDGCLMDGTLLADAIKMIDEQVHPKPVCYMTNCIHPTNLIQALNHEKNLNSPHLKRFKGIQSNASILSPEELNHCEILHQGDFEVLVDEMKYLYQKFGINILGGCCGTNDEFISLLAEEISTFKNVRLNE